MALMDPLDQPIGIHKTLSHHARSPGIKAFKLNMLAVDFIGGFELSGVLGLFQYNHRLWNLPDIYHYFSSYQLTPKLQVLNIRLLDLDEVFNDAVVSILFDINTTESSAIAVS